MSWWTHRQNNDQFVKKRNKMGLISRAYFKIQEINQKYNICKKDIKILDLGASPGGWCQYFQLFSTKIIAIDINTDFQITKNIEFYNADITDKIKISNILTNKNFNLIVSDIAPNWSGNKLIDQSKMTEIYEASLNICNNYLLKDGNLVIKCFEGEYFQALKKKMLKFFKNVYRCKPKSSRKESKEIYIIGYKLL